MHKEQFWDREPVECHECEGREREITRLCAVLKDAYIALPMAEHNKTLLKAIEIALKKNGVRV